MPFNWNNFPYTNFHELNLDWFSEHFKEIFEEWEELYNTLTQWKADTDADLAAWKTETLAAMDEWEDSLIEALDAWKTATGADISDWETDTIASLNEWKDAFETEYAALKDEVEDIRDVANTSAQEATAAATAASNSAMAAANSASSVTASATQIGASRANDFEQTAEINKIESVDVSDLVNSMTWRADSVHGYGFVMTDYMDTGLVDLFHIYDYGHYAAYINYFNSDFTRDTYIYISNDNEHVIDKSYPYFTVWIYNKNTESTDTMETVLSQIRFVKYRKNNAKLSDAYNNADNLIKLNGVWKEKIGVVVGGFSLADARIGNKISETGALNRAKTTTPLYIRHDGVTVKTGYDMSYPFMYAKVDENNTLLAYGTYARTHVLNKGIYYFLFKNSSGTAITSTDISNIENLINKYGYFDDNANEIDYTALFAANNYVESGGIVSVGDSTYSQTTQQTSVIITEFYTDHQIFIHNKESNTYQFRDSVTDENKNIIYSTGYNASSEVIEIPAGYHHIMVSRRYTATPIDLAHMATVLEIYATKNEVNNILPSFALVRNYDIENAICAIKKPDQHSNAANRTIVIMQATDTHGDVARWQHFLEAVKRYKPDIVVHTGDVLKTNYLDSARYFIDYLPDPVTLLAVGNHDGCTGANIGNGGATNDTIFTDLITPLNTKYSLGATKTYYSYKTKNLQYTGAVKFIVLNVYDYDAATGNVFTDRNHIYYSQAQINWLINELQDAVANNNPVVICAHECDAYLTPSDGGETPFNQTYERATFYSKNWTGNPICDLIEAFKSGTSINQTYSETGAGITLTVNTSFESAGHFVCWLVGHRHADFMGSPSGYHQLVISPCATACSIDIPGSTAGYSDLPRIENTRCEDAFNIYVLTPDEKKIGMCRIGSNINYALRERKCYKTSYNIT